MKISIEIDTGDEWKKSDTVIKLLNNGIEDVKKVISTCFESETTSNDVDKKAG